MLPSKMIPTNSFALFVTGLPLLPPMISAVETKLNGVSHVELSFPIDPALRQIEWRLIVMLGGARVETGQGGERRHRLTFFHVTAHRAVCSTKPKPLPIARQGLVRLPAIRLR